MGKRDSRSHVSARRALAAMEERRGSDSAASKFEVTRMEYGGVQDFHAGISGRISAPTPSFEKIASMHARMPKHAFPCSDDRLSIGGQALQASARARARDNAGAPHLDFEAAMELEHTARNDSEEKFVTSNYNVRRGGAVAAAVTRAYGRI